MNTSQFLAWTSVVLGGLAIAFWVGSLSLLGAAGNYAGNICIMGSIITLVFSILTSPELRQVKQRWRF